MPTTCTFPSGVSRGTVESNLQAPVHSEHSGEDLASETCLSVTDVNITHTEEVESYYNSSEDDKVNYETMEKLDLWNVFKELTDEYLDECWVARVETCVDIFETDRVTGNASSRQKGISEQRLRYYHNDGINSYSEDSWEEYFDAQGADLTDFESISPSEPDYPSDSDTSEDELEVECRVNRHGSRTNSNAHQNREHHPMNAITVLQTEELEEDTDLTYFALIKPGPNTLPLEEHFKLDHL